MYNTTPTAINAGLPGASVTSAAGVAGVSGYLWLALALVTLAALMFAIARLMPRSTL